MELAEAQKILGQVKTLHEEVSALDAARKEKLDQRNELIRSLEPDQETSWFSITEISRELRVTYAAVKKIVSPAPAKKKGGKKR